MRNFELSLNQIIASTGNNTVFDTCEVLRNGISEFVMFKIRVRKINVYKLFFYQ